MITITTRVEYLYRQQLDEQLGLPAQHLDQKKSIHGTMDRPLFVAWRGTTTAQRRAWWANNPKVGSFIQSMVDQEGDTRRVFVNSVAAMTIDENSSRNQRDHSAKTLYRKFEQIFPERKLRRLVPNSYIHVSVNHLYTPTIGLPILLSSCKFVKQTVGSPFLEKFYNIWKLIKSIKTVLVIRCFFEKFHVDRCHVCSFCPLSPYLSLVSGSTLSLIFSVTVSVLFTTSFTVSGTSLSLPPLNRSLSLLHQLSLVTYTSDTFCLCPFYI
jgi:hypothetical protein